MSSEMINSIVIAKNKYESAVQRGSGVNRFKEEFKTVMFNCYPDLISVIDDNKDMVNSSEVDELNKQIEKLQADLKSLNEALEESDRENNDLRKRIKKLEGSDANGKTKV